MTVDGALRVVLLVVGAVVALSFTRLSAARAPRPRPHDAPPAPAPRALRRFEPRLPLPPTLLGGRRQWAEGDPAAPFPWNQTHVHEALDPRSPLDDGPLKCDLWNNITPRLLVRTNPEVRELVFAHAHVGRVLRTLDAVLVHCREPLAWVAQWLPWFPAFVAVRLWVYEKCGGRPQAWEAGVAVPIRHVDLPNVGFNDHGYLTHLVWELDTGNVADATILLPANPHDQVCDLFNTTRELVLNPMPGFYSLTGNYLRHECGSPTYRKLYQLLSGRACGKWFSSYLFSMFFITKPRKLAVPRENFDLALHRLDGSQPPYLRPELRNRTKALLMERWHELKKESFRSVEKREPGQNWTQVMHLPGMIARHRGDSEMMERFWHLLFLEAPRMPVNHGQVPKKRLGRCWSVDGVPQDETFRRLHIGKNKLVQTVSVWESGNVYNSWKRKEMWELLRKRGC